jgi:hypothetical protein
MLFLDGAYIDPDDGTARFRWDFGDSLLNSTKLGSLVGRLQGQAFQLTLLFLMAVKGKACPLYLLAFFIFLKQAAVKTIESLFHAG